MGEQRFRIFVSSPGDVPEERRRVDNVVERFNTMCRGAVRLETVRWETSYYSAHETFQRQIPEAADCDLVLAIFRARLGTPLPASFPTLSSGEPYPSGTAYEVLSAIEGRRSGQGVPDVYVFRYPHAPQVSLDAPDRADIEAQWASLKGFFDRWFRTTGGEFLAAFQEYVSTDDFALRLEECLQQWLARRGVLVEGAHWDRVLNGSPFPGLAAFESGRRGVFFGRELAITRLIERLREIEKEPDSRLPFLVILGASGSGKSSLLRAGLLPRLKLPGTIPEIDLWRSLVFTPGPDPFLSFAEALLAEAALGSELSAGTFRTIEMLTKQLAGDPDLAAALLQDALGLAADKRRREERYENVRPARLIVAIDQAERLFTEADPIRSARFSALIASLVQARLATVVMALRSDAYAQLQTDGDLMSLRTSGAAFDLLPPNSAELEEIVSRPVAACRPPLAFEVRDGCSLATRLVADAQGGDALPLLQMTLSRLYSAEAGRGDGLLRYSDYVGINAAVATTADEALAALPSEAQAELPGLVTRLVSDVWTDPSTGKSTPAVVGLNRVDFETQRPARAALIETFVERRLLTAEGDGTLERVRPVHEALLRVWPRAVAIVAEVGHLVRVRHTLEPIVGAWKEAAADERDRHLEISPALLAGAQELIRLLDVSDAMADFVASAGAAAEARLRQEREAQERRIRDAESLAAANRRIARRTGAGLLVAMLLTALAGWQWANAARERVEAQAQRNRAERSLALATKTANGLVFDLAEKFKTTVGVPAATVEDILDKARQLQDQLIHSGETSLDLRLSQAQALQLASETLLTLGRSGAALAAARQAKGIFEEAVRLRPDRDDFRRAISSTDNDIGDALDVQGHLREALASYQASLEIDQHLAAADVNDLGRQRDLVVSYNKIGNIYHDLSELDAALSSFQAALAIGQKLAAANPTNTVWQDDLAFAYEEIGDVLDAQRRFPEARSSYAASLAISERLAKAMPNDTARQRGLMVAYIKVGDAAQDLGKHSAALDAFRSADAVADRLAHSDPTNKVWQRDVSTSKSRLGSILRQLGRLPEALSAFRSSLEIDERLAQTDADNLNWKRDVALSYENVADTLRKMGNVRESEEAARAAFELYKTILKSDPNSRARGDLARCAGTVASLSFDRNDDAGALFFFKQEILQLEAVPSARDFEQRARVGRLHHLVANIERELARDADALADYKTSLAIFSQLARDDPGGGKRQIDIAEADGGIGSILEKQGDRTGALAAYEASAEAIRKLDAIARAGAKPQMELAEAEDAIGDLRVEQHDDAGALDAFRAELAVRRRLAETAPGDADASRDLAATYLKLADVLQNQSKTTDAVPLYKARIAILQKLAAAAPAAQTEFQLAGSAAVLGNVLRGQNDLPEALQFEQIALDAMTRMVKVDPGNPKWHRYLAIAQESIGEIETLQGRTAEALDILRASLQQRQEAVRLKPEDGEVRRELAAVHEDIGDALLASHDAAGALAAFETAAGIAEELVRGQPDSVTFVRELLACDDRLGSANAALGRNDAARADVMAGHAMAIRMARLHPDQLEFADDAKIFADELAKLSPPSPKAQGSGPPP